MSPPKRRYRNKGSGLTRRIRRELRVFQGGRCYLCGRLLAPPFEPCGDGLAATVDHVVPLSLGGADQSLNKLLAHRACNVAKGTRLPYPCEILYSVAVHRRRIMARHRDPAKYMAIDGAAIRALDAIEARLRPPRISQHGKEGPRMADQQDDDPPR